MNYYGNTTVVLPPKRKEDNRKEDNRKEIENKRNKIKEIYNTFCTNLPQVQKLTDKRNTAIDKFIKEFTEEQFEQICQIANSTDFLIGKNDKGWKADFDFLMRIDKATNIIEGKYNNTKGEIKKEEKQEELKEIDISRLTPEEYDLLVKKKITIQDLIKKGRINV